MKTTELLSQLNILLIALNIVLFSLDNVRHDDDGISRVGAACTRRAVMAAAPHPGTEFDSFPAELNSI